MVSALTRVFGTHHLALAEDVVQEALVQALRQWPFAGIPQNPAGWLYRVAKHRAIDVVRREQALVYALAAQPDLESATLPLLAGPHAAELAGVGQALRALWHLSGIDAGTPVHPRYSRQFAGSEPVDALLGEYRSAAAGTGLDWTYLAAINFIESDFGRTLGPSTAGALGPMQFLPDTFREYGRGGNIMSPHDSIRAAALLLARNGAPSDYDRAILRYNYSQDYLTAVKGYAAAMRSDPLWLTRFYYWSTYG